MGKHSSLAKRKRDAVSRGAAPSWQTRRARAAARQTDFRAKLKTTRHLGNISLGGSDDDDDEDEDDDDYEEEDNDDDDRVPSPPPPPPQPPKDIDSNKLPVLLSLFCGPKAITGEIMFFLVQVGSIAEIKSLLGKHFFWEMRRAGVQSDLNFMRINCFSPDRDGPIRGAWPISTADVYQQWWDGLLAGSYKQGQFARIQVVAMTDYMLWRDEKTYRDYLKLDENPVAFWFQPLMEEMDGTKWVFDKPMDEAIDGTEWTGEKAKEGEKEEGEEENSQ